MSDIEIAQRATMKPIVGLAQKRLGIGKELRERLGNILAGCNHDDKTPIFARDLKAHGAMASLLKDALRPNLVQTLENNPVFIHGGPFANIALGCNTVIATKTALKLADIVVTEAGFGASGTASQQSAGTVRPAHCGRNQPLHIRYRRRSRPAQAKDGGAGFQGRGLQTLG